MTKLPMIIILSLLTSIGLQYALAFSDPTRPPPNIQEPTVVSPTAFTLNAIISGGGRNFAVINGLSKKMGDEILGERVTIIGKDRVQLEGPSGKITLFLFGPTIKDSGTIQCKGNLVVCKDVGY